MYTINMDDKEQGMPPVLLQEILAANKIYGKILLEKDIAVLCVNKTTKKERWLSFKALYDNNQSFWLHNGAWEFFLAAKEIALLKELALAPGASWSKDYQTGDGQPVTASTTPQDTGDKAGGFGSEYEAIAAMSEEKQIELITEDTKRLDDLLGQKRVQKEEKITALVDSTRNAALVNQITLMDAMNMADDAAKMYTLNLVDTTAALISSSTQLVSRDIFNDDLMNTLVAKSNGTIIQHMTRTFLNGVAFLAYYNELVSGTSIVNKLRISFNKYRPFYSALLPHIEPEKLSLERVFLEGMCVITKANFQNWAAGFLIHDIGKASMVEYHEGEAAYNRDIVVEHVKLGYSSVMNKTHYPREAGLITGYHHEYYGDSGGYGYFRSYLEQYRKANPVAKQDYCISYELEPVLDYRVLSYFPAKILEIIDIYDSVTDPNRKYRKALTPEEALVMIREEFIEKHRKIDPLLFEIFTAFVQKSV
ncbi:hypothetical protein FACS1894161_1640 [Spirochaetia bacterium]|nr:hypothetical protein FACS1894161_1640 [Spirochaetia bacterium]